ncbi:Hypothetical protein FKW44_006421 [Caligus rogercresseyi]|uniref:Uncharacterized protein n=1 Tax=Caligus rogercresseyi TaxID=217165 RepID=A0A7T8QSW2_CALRO|nr:Hypothetical protein FKW44_006421 [Caligus rogercresseyi]
MNLLEDEYASEQRGLPKLPTQRRCAAHTSTCWRQQTSPKWWDGTIEQAGSRLPRQPSTPMSSGTCHNSPLCDPTRTKMWWQKLRHLAH